MARKTIEVTLQDRENSWTFVIEEMPATRLEAWIIRALLLVAGSGCDNVPEGADLKKAGAFLAEKGLGVLGGLDYEKAKPLLDEMLGCCSRREGQALMKCTPESVDGYIEDVATLFKLRLEAVKLNLGFLGAGIGEMFGSRNTPATETT